MKPPQHKQKNKSSCILEPDTIYNQIDFTDLPFNGGPLSTLFNIQTDKIYDSLQDEDLLSIFMLAEYIKRKFYLDCCIEKKGDNYTKEERVDFIYLQYKPLNLNYTYLNPNDRLHYLSDFFTTRFFPEDSSENGNCRACFNINSKHDALLQQIAKNNIGRGNIYRIIRIMYKDSIAKIKDIINHIDKYKILSDQELHIVKSICERQRQVTLDDCKYLAKDQRIKYIKNLREKQLNIYDYEHFLYLLSIKDIFGKQQNSALNNLINFIYEYFQTSFSTCFLSIYKFIIQRYSLYMFDLFNIKSMESIINNNYKIPRPAFFLLFPKTTQIASQMDNFVKIVLDQFSGKINIEIDMKNVNLNIADVIRFIGEQITAGSYVYKQIGQIGYTKEEIKLFCEYIDSDNKKNKTYKPEERINSLCIWDNIFLKQGKGSVPYYLKNRCQLKHDDRRMNRNYERYLRATSKCIETGAILPLTS